MPESTAATIEQWRDAYQAKIDDLAHETLRASTLVKVVQRMYRAMPGWGQDAGYLPHQVRRFFMDGFPPDEREALLAVLDEADRHWLLTGEFLEDASA
jgi:hypothetical protein